MKRFICLISFLFLALSCANGQKPGREHFYDTPEDREIFAAYLSAMEGKNERSMADLIVETALFFQETPYVGGTLEKEPEGLVINLREMDCLTFVENVFSLVRTLKDKDPSYDTFCDYLQQLRYREGQITDYTDRLHYTTDWIFENERKSLLEDKTKAIGGEPLALSLSFMSTHPESYAQLNENPERIAVMAEKEKEINRRSYYYIAEEEIDRLADGMRSGDMVGFVTSIAGLDISHVGILYRTKGRLTFIHASSTAKKVIVQEGTLTDYVKRIKTNKGVMIIRSQR
ncbi:hypothetical protein M2137_002280 [Parabacteroides sp. PFB2-10]|uniref:N-acetylmuramoyl-L-alanine amidase-like domain-containing protein n=1 Tax=Parabacteroides sp. PFB2-10 TaxID=1742405 RepID=UPI0024756CBF|nr:N-acetylmuramoyl-L-alanine amidase-like domain-containing protein [Parabacteroides sp. PFB2-10]MDH6313490.1 hypothetical protein [Parabacteroides sp. PFB2-10]